MRVLQVIHGYPMRYNAGSEVYTQTLCRELASRHEVHVFTREEDSFAPDFTLREEVDDADPAITVHLVNVPRYRDRYRSAGVDARLEELLERVQPEVILIGHLNHLSTSLVEVVARRGLPIVYTLHDYWLMCPRGQFMQMHPEDECDLWAACDGQDDETCARRCYARYFSGSPDEEAIDVVYWTEWVARRMRHVRAMTDHVDLFVAPSHYLLDRYARDFELPAHKLTFLDYGFDRRRLTGRERTPGEPFTFGYIGTHIPAKGIHQLVEAFGRLRGRCQLRIWGRPRGQDTAALRALADALPGDAGARIHWMGEYRNDDIVRDVFNHVDAIVVPSIWVENSPLVIHEAQQARVAVITADAGGMAEYVHHDVNGLLFRHRDAGALCGQMQRFVDDPQLAIRLGARGYLYSSNGDIPDVHEHGRTMEALCEHALERRRNAAVTPRRAPWRVTLDTNPDTCNLHCIMCEEHSPHSDRQELRRDAGKPRRVMDEQLMLALIDEAAGMGVEEIIPSTMGEPLLYPYIDSMLERCVARGLRLNLTTNGTFPRRSAGEWARRIVPITSDVKISINGARADTQHRVMPGTNLDRLIDDVRAFIAVRDAHAAAGGNRCRVTFQVTFLEDNVAELADLVALAARLGVDRVKGHHLWVHFDELAERSMRRSPQSIMRWNSAVVAAQGAVKRHLLPSGGQVLLDNVFPLTDDATDDLAPGGPCPFLGQEAWINAEGRFDPCCAPDELRKTLGDFGSVAVGGLKAVWDGVAYRRLCASYSTRSLCVGCNMRRPVEEAR